MLKIKALALTAGFLTCAAAISAPCFAGTLKVFFPFQSDSGVIGFVNEFQKIYKGTRITPLFMEGNGQDFASVLEKKPDVYFGHTGFIEQYGDIGIFEDLYKYIDKAALRDILPAYLNAYTIEKRLLAIPLLGQSGAFLYNKKAFSEVGLSAPNQNWTWAKDFYQAARKLSRDTNGDGIPERAGLAAWSDFFYSMIHSYGGTIVDKAFKKVTYTEKPAMEAANLWLKFNKERLIEQYDNSQFVSGKYGTYPYFNGKSGMYVTSTNTLNAADLNKQLKSNGVQFESGYALMPRGPKGAMPEINSMVMCILKTCKNKKEAAQFVKYAAGYKGQCFMVDKFKSLPTSQEGLKYKKVASYASQPFINQYKRGIARSVRKGYNNLYYMFSNDIRQLALGEISMADLTDNAKTRGTEIVQSSTYSW